MPNSVITIAMGFHVETFSSLTACCRKHPEFSYSYLKAMKFPFRYKGYTFTKTPIQK